MMNEQLIETREGKKIFVRVVGKGEPLLLIHGVMVDADFYLETAKYLSRFYQVITYDRRGYSRSEVCHDYTLIHQADDAADVLKVLNIDSAVIVGCSAGGLIGMKFAEIYPEMLKHLYVHEPPIICFDNVLTPEERKWLNEIDRYREEGDLRKGVMKFVIGLADTMDSRTKPNTPEQMERQMKNGLIFIRYEFPDQFSQDVHTFDFDLLKSIGNIDVIASDANHNTYTFRAATALAKQVEKPVLYCGGYHNVAHDLPFEFACFLHGLIEMRKED